MVKIYKNTLIKTVDGGHIWKWPRYHKKNDNKWHTTSWFLDEYRGWVVSCGGVVDYTTDGGNTWVQQDIDGSFPPTFYSDGFRLEKIFRSIFRKSQDNIWEY